MPRGSYTLLVLALVAPVGAAALPAESAPPAPPVLIWKPYAAWYPQKQLPVVQPTDLEVSEPRLRAGDDARWARPDWDDRDWTPFHFTDLPARTGIIWVRWRVRRHETQRHLPEGLALTALAAYDLYWDGVWVGHSGVPGNRLADEVPGWLDNCFDLPVGDLSGGEHVVALRLSNYRCGFPNPRSSFSFFFGTRSEIEGANNRAAILPAVGAGAMYMMALICAVMWLLAARRAVLLWFGSLWLCPAMIVTLGALRFLRGYPYDWTYPNVLASTGLTGAEGACIVATVLTQFGVPRRRWAIAGLAVLFPLIVVLSPSRQNLEGHYMLETAFAFSLAGAIWAARAGRRGVGIVIGGIVLSMGLCVVCILYFAPGMFFLTMLPTLLGLTSAYALEVREERRRAQQAQLTSARLELELLKKNIQPHFLLNTLATILETIEQEPRTAAALVEALAGEFRILSRVAGEPLIPLAQELSLCRAHLAVMSRQRGVRCALEAGGVDEAALVPPALFHTLVENGLTHLLPRDGRIDFELCGARDGRGSRYTLVARGERQADTPSGNGREGTGLRYVKARLEESFPGRWSLFGEPVPGGWRTIIAIGAPGAGKVGAA